MEILMKKAALGSVQKSLQPLEKSGKTSFSSFFGGLGQTMAGKAAMQQATEGTKSLLSLFDGFFTVAEDLEKLTAENEDLRELIMQLQQEGELPTVNELVMLLQIDGETLLNAIQAALHAVDEPAVSVTEAGLENSDQFIFIQPLTQLLTALSKNPDKLQLLSQSESEQMQLSIKASAWLKQFAEHAGKDTNKPALQLFQQAFQKAEQAAQGAAALSLVTSVESKQLIAQSAFTASAAAQDKQAETQSKPTPVRLHDTANPLLLPISKAEQFAMSVKTAPRPMNMEQFIEKLQQIISQSSMVKGASGTKMLIKLYPEQLGSIRIELLQQNGTLTAKIMSSTQAVKELLESNSSQLRAAFQQQNVQVDKVDVSSFADQQRQLMDKQQQQPQQDKQQQNGQQDETADQDDRLVFADILQHSETEGDV